MRSTGGIPAVDGPGDASSSNDAPAAELLGISKAFFGVLANDRIDLDLRHGEVHALLGENGAGKSTLCSILAGLYKPDAGEILIDGIPQTFHSPRNALAAGVGMVYQHFRLVDTFTVAESLALGHPDAGFRLSPRRLEIEAASLCDRFGIQLDPQARIWELSVGEQQRVEILKLLYRDVRILILDEPTAVLTTQEADALFRAVRAIRLEGKSVVFVSHKLREILAVADRVTVLRAGKRVGQTSTANADPADLARLMIAREFAMPELQEHSSSDQVALVADGLVVAGERGNRAVRDFSLQVRSGEIVGIAGIAGNGQRELSEALAGLRRVESGRIELNGRDVTLASPMERIRHGLGYVPEDRLEMGVAAGLPLEDNLVLKSYRTRRFSRGPILSSKAVRAWSTDLSERFDIRGVRNGMPVSLLSGGNLQRAILARELSQRPQVLIAASPTRGLDLAAVEGVRRHLLEQRAQGTAILLISEDLEELQALSDRILVLYEGSIVGEVSPGGLDDEQVGLMMAGHLRQTPD
jgi:general nucleoside transport system ATP-binding protein